MDKEFSLIVIRGGGDLASGVALRLFRAGLRVVITERPQPLAVRRLVSFAEAVYRGQITVEGVTASCAQTPPQALELLLTGQIPVLVDPDFTLGKGAAAPLPQPLVMIDARMTKKSPEYGLEFASFIIGLGPGFVAGENCHAAVETNRGHFLGRVLWQGATQADTGIPGVVANRQQERVLRAPAAGRFSSQIEIGSRVAQGQILGEVAGQPLIAPFTGTLRGLIHAGVKVTAGMKIGDLDPREDPQLPSLVSEKALAIGGGVLEAILTWPEIRTRLWS